MRNSKKVLSWALILATALTLLPATAPHAAAAAETFTLYFGMGEAEDDGRFTEGWGLYTDFDYSQKYSGGNWKGDPFTLTLDNFSFTTNASTESTAAALDVIMNTKIILIGENTLVSSGTDENNWGIAAQNGLTITSESGGTLNIVSGAGTDNSRGISVNSGNLTINGSAVVSIETGASAHSAAIWTAGTGNVTIGNSAKVTAAGNNGTVSNNGVKANNLTVNNSATLSATSGGGASTENFGVKAGATVTFNSSGTVTAGGGPGANSIGVSASMVTIVAGTVSASGKTAGIKAGSSVTIGNGANSVSVTATADDDGGFGILVQGGIEISGDATVLAAAPGEDGVGVSAFSVYIHSLSTDANLTMLGGGAALKWSSGGTPYVVEAGVAGSDAIGSEALICVTYSSDDGIYTVDESGENARKIVIPGECELCDSCAEPETVIDEEEEPETPQTEAPLAEAPPPPPPAPSEPPLSVLIVDGEEVSAGEVTVDEESGTVTVTVNQDIITAELEKAADHLIVIIPDGGNVSTAKASITAKNIADMAAKGMDIIIQSGGVRFEIPASAIGIAEAADWLGAETPADVAVIFTITTVFDEDVLERIKAAVDRLGAEPVLPPILFAAEAVYAGRSVEITGFSRFVRRAVEIGREDAERIDTAVVIEEDGSARHVPTYVGQAEATGSWYAAISSMTNSIYVLVSNGVSFEDVKGEWFEAFADEMGSRKVIAGVGGGLFDGRRDITRAEFAAIIVNALGLPSGGDSDFGDVETGAWYRGYVSMAYEIGLMEGVGNGLFAPDRKITRQEAMVIVWKAARLAGLNGSSGDLTDFADADGVSPWALDAVAWNVGSGLIVGAAGRLSPTDSITRAETAALILNFLRAANLVDIRTVSRPD